MKLNRPSAADAGNNYVVGPVSPPPVSGERSPVEFLRLPPPGQRCPHTGLSRSYLNDLILPTSANGHKPPVRSFVLRKRGAKSGVRIIDAASLFDWIRRHADTSAATGSEEGGDPA